MYINQRKAGVILSYTSQLIKILSGVLYTPIMLRLLGQSEYGLYQLVYSVVSYLSLLSLGFGSSYIRFYSKAKNEENEVEKLNGMFIIIFLVISCICLLCGVVMISNISSIFGNGLSGSEYKIAKILMMLMVFNLALTFPNSVFNSYISAHEEFIFQKTMNVLHNIMNPFITLPLLILGYGSIGMVLVTTFLTIVSFIVNILYCMKNLKMKFQFHDIQFSKFKELWSFTFFIFLNQIIDQINWSVDKFLIGRLSGTTAVAVYGIGSQINGYYVELSTSISNVFIPKVNRLIASSDDNCEVTELFIKVGRSQFMILSLVLSGFTFFGEKFIEYWAGKGYHQSYFVTLFLIIPVTVPLIQNLGIEIQRAKNKHKTRSIVYFFVALGNVFISIPLIDLYGPTGAAIGTAIALTVGNIMFMNWYYYCRLNIDIIKFWKSIFSIFPSLCIPCITGCIIRRLLDLDNIYVFLISGLTYVLVFLLCLWIWGMNDLEKKSAKEMSIKLKNRG